MLEIVVTTTLMAMSVVVLCLSGHVIYKRWPYFCTYSKAAINDNDLATRSFIRLLDEAESKMFICDDGDTDTSKSIYENDDVILRVDKKLRENPNFKIFCVFNTTDKNKFRQKFEGQHSQVCVTDRTDIPVPYNFAHYKIIDNAKKAYLSWHTRSSEHRNVHQYDFSGIKKIRRGQIDVIQESIGDYLEDIEKYWPSQLVRN